MMKVESTHYTYISKLSKSFEDRVRFFKIIPEGISILDKAHLLFYTLMLQFPKRIHRMPQFQEALNLMVRGTTVRCLGCLFKLNAYDDIRLHTDLTFESEIQDWFKISNNGIFLDVGANIGRYTVSIAKKVGRRGRVFAFEPCFSTYLTLVRNVQLNRLKNVITFPFALWNNNGFHHFYTKTNAGSNSLINNDRAIGKEKVITRTLDKLLNTLHISKIDLIKIDVEGAEKEVLEGMKNTLQHFEPRLIIEVQDSNVSWVNNFLSRLGYKEQEKHDINHLYYRI